MLITVVVTRDFPLRQIMLYLCSVVHILSVPKVTCIYMYVVKNLGGHKCPLDKKWSDYPSPQKRVNARAVEVLRVID